jgi:hypothetical protein
LTFYPNPTTGQVIFESKEGITAVEIYTLYGVRISQVLYNGVQTATQDFSGLAQGVYFTKVYCGREHIYTERVILH